MSRRIFRSSNSGNSVKSCLFYQVVICAEIALMNGCSRQCFPKSVRADNTMSGFLSKYSIAALLNFLCWRLLITEEDDEDGNALKSVHSHESIAVAAAKLVVHKLVPQVTFSPNKQNKTWRTGGPPLVTSLSGLHRCIVALLTWRVFGRSVCQDFLAPEIVSHFVLHDKPVADVVKRLCSTLKDRSSSTEQADLYSNALQKVWKQLQPPSSSTFHALCLPNTQPIDSRFIVESSEQQLVES